MIDKVNKVFAALVKPHWIKYVLVFFFIGIVFFSFYPFPKDIKSSFFTSNIVYLIASLVLCGSWANLIFYSKQDRVFLDSRDRAGIPATDTYFYTKINSDISFVNKFFGYAYVLLKVFGFSGLGYILAMGLFALINLKG